MKITTEVSYGYNYYKKTEVFVKVFCDGNFIGRYVQILSYADCFTAEPCAGINNEQKQFDTERDCLCYIINEYLSFVKYQESKKEKTMFDFEYMRGIVATMYVQQGINFHRMISLPPLGEPRYYFYIGCAEAWNYLLNRTIF